MEVDKLKEFMGENEKKQMKEDIAVQEAVTLIADDSGRRLSSVYKGVPPEGTPFVRL